MFASLHFAVGEEVVLEDRLKALRDMGYAHEDKVDTPSTFARRGGVLDVFPWGYSFPIRVEFMNNAVESIYTFDPASGSLLEPHQMTVILPVGDRAIRKKDKGIAWAWGEKPINPFVDLEKGQLVVHILHGIGQFRGIVKMAFKGETCPHLDIEYADKERLYVPLSDLHLIQRYVALGMSRARKQGLPLSKLGSKKWRKIRQRAQKGILSYASELLELQAKRELVNGVAFLPDDDWQARLESEFPFEETPDQVQAAGEVKKDMQSTRPMDRLICGDVGYGKTEVALRAVFKAIMGKKQAAILVPTTILAEQHFETFSERFKSFPVEVAMLSRFQTRAKQKEIVKQIALGKTDLVIGTHRLLSKDISFHDLGILVIDEEQRFGVRHKDRLKRYRLEVDVLTMTATPIPRTLYMSLVGGKDMSVISSPPKNRVPVKSRVVEFNDVLIKEAIRRELKRKGQTFFIHNRVESIQATLEKLKKLVPEASMAFAHGQMHPKELESVMHRFIHEEIDVLVSTTIVESGIDIPNANTLFVNRADAFGLSELYQLKGRVGRFNREAYAYFLIPGGATLTHESQRRLKAIEKYDYLGSGFNIAMADLEIRGAGNLLGTEQSGFVSTVGFDLYCRLLKDAIESLKK
jgi:transcription-repair coupling factor (superfamily II helicase)